MGEILIPRRTKVEKGYELLADITVGTATTSVDITGLNIGKGDEVVLVSDINNTAAIYTIVYLYINNNKTNSNYYYQNLNASAGVVGAERNTAPKITTSVGAGTKGLIQTVIKLTNRGYCTQQAKCLIRYGGGTCYLEDNYVTSTFTASSITSFSIVAHTTNAIGIGSRFQLYKIGGA